MSFENIFIAGLLFIVLFAVGAVLRIALSYLARRWAGAWSERRRGNVFFVLFCAVSISAVIGAGAMQTMAGSTRALSTSNDVRAETLAAPFAEGGSSQIEQRPDDAGAVQEGTGNDCSVNPYVTDGNHANRDASNFCSGAVIGQSTDFDNTHTTRNLTKEDVQVWEYECSAFYEKNYPETTCARFQNWSKTPLEYPVCFCHTGAALVGSPPDTDYYNWAYPYNSATACIATVSSDTTP